MRRLPAVVLFLLSACASAGTRSAEPPPAPGSGPARAAFERARPLPFPLPLPAGFEQAIANGTRTPEGRPGPRYWQQWAEYDLSARVFPEEKRLEGSARIRYVNHSPDTLTALVVDLTQNHHRAGAVRNQPAEVTGGLRLERVSVGGTDLDSLPLDAPPPAPGAAIGPLYQVQETKLFIAPPTPLPPGKSADLAFEWSFTVPQQGASGRMGWSGDDLLFLAYWYPQMAVYDDVVGWHLDPFLGTAEFYAGFADYDLRVEAPAGWVVVATGELQNAEEVLSPAVLERLRRAETSDDVVRVLGPGELDAAATRGTGWLSWHFEADSVRDVAFSLTRESIWDAARSPVGDRDGDGDEDYARVDALWRESAPRWAQVARYAQHAVAFLSGWTGLPYLWPHMSVIEASGIIGGGMEFPMMTIIGDYNADGDSALYNVTVHEIAHMWLPMMVASDERRYGWLDEGMTTFNENEARKDFFPGSDPEADDWEIYALTALAGVEGEILRPTDYHVSSQAFTVASYQKPALLLAALRGLLGEETFTRAYREFLHNWAWKHPYPWDFFHTVESVSGRDLGWFWSSWYDETWILDQAVQGVTTVDGATRIVIEDRGRVPMPARVSVTFADGETVAREVPVETWLEGATTATVTVPGDAPVARVEIDPDRQFPDVDRSNNVWTAGP